MAKAMKTGLTHAAREYGVLNTTAPETAANLNEWGAQGWELVHVERELRARSGSIAPVHCFMKRPIPEPTESRWGSAEA